jgi:hypothetical protein
MYVNAYWQSGVTGPFLPYLGTGWRYMVSLPLRRPFLREQISPYPLKTLLDQPQSRAVSSAGENIFLPLLRIATEILVVPARCQFNILTEPFPLFANGRVLLLNRPRRHVSIWVPSYWRSLISFQADFRSDYELATSNIRHSLEHLTVFSLNNESVELWSIYHRHPVINDSALCCEIPDLILCCAPQIQFILIPLFPRNVETNDENDLTEGQNRISSVFFLKLCKLNLLKPTGYVMHQQFNISTTVRSAHTVFMCLLFIW